MYYQHDWFMLQIQMMVQFIAKVTFQKDPFEIDALFDTEWGHTETDPLEKEIAALFAQSRFQEAESLVLKRLSSKQPAALKTALSFYNALNQLPDERLNAHGDIRRDFRWLAGELITLINIEWRLIACALPIGWHLNTVEGFYVGVERLWQFRYLVVIVKIPLSG